MVKSVFVESCFISMRPPPACGADTPAKARDRAAPDRSPLNSGERPMSEEQTPCHPVLLDLPVGTTALNTLAGGIHDPMSFGSRP